MTEEKLKSLIAQGENGSVEFKRAEVHPESLAKEMVAFANSLGGSILLGVDDDGQISGVPDAQKTEEWVAQITRVHVIPPIQAKVMHVISDEKPVVVVQVPKGKDKPYQTSKFQYLVRVGTTNRVASVQELMRLFQESGMFHFDSTTIENTSAGSLNWPKLDLYFSQYGLNFSDDTQKEQLLTNTDILGANGQATVAGLLVFGTNPQRHLRDASISFAHFAGTAIGENLLDKKVIEGTLDYQIDTCVAAIRDNLRHPSIINGTRTESTQFEYPEKVFRELIVNACLHRNYAISGSRIRVFLFDDRLEVHSPGRLPNTVTAEKMRAGVSYSVNPVLLKFMENLRYIDKLGRGIPMVNQIADQNHKQLLLEESGEEFIVTLEL